MVPEKRPLHRGRNRSIIYACISGLIVLESVLVAGAVNGSIITEKSTEDLAYKGQTAIEGKAVIISWINDDTIQMFGDPLLWDDEKNMSIDLNRDGKYEDFAIARDPNEVILLEGGTKQTGNWKTINFWTDHMCELLRKSSTQARIGFESIDAADMLTLDLSGMTESLRTSGCMMDNICIRISCCDIDEDGMKEVLVSAGNKNDENITAIYEYSESTGTPFTYRGYISSFFPPKATVIR